MEKTQFIRSIKIARLTREIDYFTKRVEKTSSPVTPAQKNAHTRAARCLKRRKEDLQRLSASV
jgi:cob(I)alamin adenosyltransferase